MSKLTEFSLLCRSPSGVSLFSAVRCRSCWTASVTASSAGLVCTLVGATASGVGVTVRLPGQYKAVNGLSFHNRWQPNEFC